LGEFGVVQGQVCPECGVEDAVPVVVGMPDASLFEAADRGLVVLAGCVVFEGRRSFHCRACSHEWGHEGDPTTDEQQLADLLAVGHDDVVRAIGSGWRRAGQDLAAVTWLVSGRPAQVDAGVGGGMVVLGPVAAMSDVAVAWDDGRTFSRDDVLSVPDLLAQTADEIATARRRTFRWCRTCRRPYAPEDFAGYRGTCIACASRSHR
jgi:hypothetical protein